MIIMSVLCLRGESFKYEILSARLLCRNEG